MAAFLLTGCSGGPDTDSGADTDRGADGDARWDLPGEAPPTDLEVIWVGRFEDEGDIAASTAVIYPNGRMDGIMLLEGGYNEFYHASVIVIAVDYPDPCAALTHMVEAHNAAGELADAGDLAGAAAVMQSADAVGTPADIWSLSASFAANGMAELESWEVTDFGAPQRMVPAGVGAVFHQPQDRDYEAEAADQWDNEDAWAMSGSLAMTALDRAAGTLEVDGTVDLRRCPPYDPAIGFAPCQIPSDTQPEGSVEVALTATRCESLEDVIGFAW